MPQGYTESPTYYSQVLKSDLADIVYPKDYTLLY